MQYLGNKPVQGIGRSKNLIPFPYTTIATIGGVKHTFNSDGSITLKGTRIGNAYLGLYGGYKAQAVPVTSLLEVGKTYTISGSSDLVKVIIFLYPESGGSKNYTSGSFTVTENDKYIGIFLYIPTASATVNETIHPMLNEGTTTLPYQPYLQRYDMYMYDNLIKQPYFDNKLNGYVQTVAGVTFTTDESTGYVTANGKNDSTAWSRFYFIQGGSKKLNGKYVCKCTPSGGATTTYRTIITVKKQDGTTQSINEIGNGVTFTADNWELNAVTIVIYTNATANNLVFKPELIRLIGD